MRHLKANLKITLVHVPGCESRYSQQLQSMNKINMWKSLQTKEVKEVYIFQWWEWTFFLSYSVGVMVNHHQFCFYCFWASSTKRRINQLSTLNDYFAIDHQGNRGYDFKIQSSYIILCSMFCKDDVIDMSMYRQYTNAWNKVDTL